MDKRTEDERTSRMRERGACAVAAAVCVIGLALAVLCVLIAEACGRWPVLCRRLPPLGFMVLGAGVQTLWRGWRSWRAENHG